MSDDVTLFHMPGACARVVVNALEEIQIAYDLHMIAFGKTRSPEYLAINPKGSVPALRIGSRILTENAAILYYLHQCYPDAGLLPDPSTLPPNSALEDLVWLSSTVHVAVRQIRMPSRFSEEGADAIRAKGMLELTPMADRVASRVTGGWWYGSEWSIVDVYLAWCFSTAASAGFLLPEPLNAHLHDRKNARQSVGNRYHCRLECACSAGERQQHLS
jgi:glutathione S-transferase